MSSNSSSLRTSVDYPKRIISLSPSNSEILFAIGAGNEVVGVTDYCNFPTELVERVERNEITKVGGYWNPSIERILELKPDLVLVSAAKCDIKTNDCKMDCSRRCELTIKTAKKLISLGLNVDILAPHSMDDILENILTVGNLTGRYSMAHDLVEKLRQRIKNVLKHSSSLDIKPKVYFEVWNNPYISVNSKTWIGNLISLAGGTNIFEQEISEWPIIYPEDVVKHDPDIMLFPVIPGIPRFWQSFSAIKKRQGWPQISAIKNDRLYELLRDCISRPGPRLVETLELMDKLFHTT